MKRNVGIDFLRILSMFMVVVLHLLGHGGILANAEPLSAKYWAAWALEIICSSGVNCFALISGYVMYQSSCKFSRIPKIWLQTVFYTLLAVLVFALFVPGSIGFKSVLYALLPVSTSRYWYISAYVGMLVLLPMLNATLRHLEKRELASILVTVFVLFCVCPSLVGFDPYKLSAGYSVLWLSLLYLTGGFLHKYDVTEKVRTAHAWLLAFLMFALFFLLGFLSQQVLQGRFPLGATPGTFIPYTSPGIVLMSLCLLIICSKLHFSAGTTKLLKFISPAVLGVYLIHTNPLVWKFWLVNCAVSFLNVSCAAMVALILLSALLIFCLGFAIDLVRIRLFSLLKIDQLCSALDDRLTKTSAKL